MSKHKRNLEEVFDIDRATKLTFSEKEGLYQSIVSAVKRKRRKRFLSTVSAIAAVCVGVLVVFYAKYGETSLSPTPSIKSIALKHAAEFIDDDNVQVASFEIEQGKTNVKTLELDTEDEQLRLSSNPSQDGYSTFFIPYGKRQEIILPDGSTVWLNSGSYFTYRNNFDGDLREVYLNGEAFFDIKKNGSQFVVRTAQADIMVLGTSFNASSYEDDNFFSVELLTGKVELNSPGKKFKSFAMNKGERVTLDFIKNTIRLDNNSIGDDVLWTKRQLALRNVTMPELLKRMERIYNVKINAVNEVYTMDIGYSGRLNVAVDVEKSLASIYELQNYDIKLKEKEVFITKKK